MVAIGIGFRSFAARHAAARKKRSLQNRESLLISLILAFSEDGDVIPHFSPKKHKKKHSANWLFDDLGRYARGAFRMLLGAFQKLHGFLKPYIKEVFTPKGGNCAEDHRIQSSLRLATALLMYAGSSV